MSLTRTREPGTVPCRIHEGEGAPSARGTRHTIRSPPGTILHPRPPQTKALTNPLQSFPQPFIHITSSLPNPTSHHPPRRLTPKSNSLPPKPPPPPPALYGPPYPPSNTETRMHACVHACMQSHTPIPIIHLCLYISRC